MLIENVSYPHHGRCVDATVYWPDAAEAVPCVILCHGYNGCKEDTALQGSYLADHAIAAVCISFCGGSVRDKSGFPTTQMTLWTERDDILAVVDALRQDSRVSDVFLYGESMGGMASVLASAIAQDHIAGLGLLYPALCIADNWLGRYPLEEDIPETAEFWNMTLGKCFFYQIRDLHIYTVLQKYQGPVLLMHGEKDSTVPIVYSEKARDLYCDVTYVPFHDEGHGFSDQGLLRVCELLCAFVKQHMNCG